MMCRRENEIWGVFDWLAWGEAINVILSRNIWSDTIFESIGNNAWNVIIAVLVGHAVMWRHAIMMLYAPWNTKVKCQRFIRWRTNRARLISRKCQWYEAAWHKIKWSDAVRSRRGDQRTLKRRRFTPRGKPIMVWWWRHDVYEMMPKLWAEKIIETCRYNGYARL